MHKAPTCWKGWDYSQATADYIFGAIVAGTGLLATPLGGWLLDREMRGEGMSSMRRASIASKQIAIQAMLGAVLCCVATQMESPMGFFGLLTLGCFFLSLTIAGTNIAILNSVAPASRPMAVALSIIVLHGLGDVPSPLVIGVIADKTQSPPLTLLVTAMYLVVAVLCWSVAWCIAGRNAALERSGVKQPLLSSGEGRLDGMQPSVQTLDNDRSGSSNKA